MFRYLVLGLLRDGVPHHGYALMKEYGERAGLRMSSGNFYRELARLVAEGLVTTVDRAPGDDPRRAPYQITHTGSAAFEAWMAGPHDAAGSAAHDDELSVMVLFLEQGDEAVLRQTLTRLQEDLWMRSKLLERSLHAAAARARGSAPSFDSLTLLLRRRQKRLAAEVEFLEELQSTYEAWAAERSKTEKRGVRPAERSAQRRVPRDGK